MSESLTLEDVLAAIPEPTASLLSKVARVAARRSQTLYLVGGPVRDLLLGRIAIDIDLMVEQDAQGLVEAVATEWLEEPLRVIEHPRFGTLRLESSEAALDIAHMRHETYSHPGALPEVAPGTLEQDVARRDFSINALLCPLDGEHPSRAHVIIDLCGGIKDLRAGRLRVLHPRSFHDDPTRAWRGARFAARLGMTFDRRSRSALRDALRDGAFGAVSGERFRRELIATFEESERGTHPGRILRLLADWHVLPALEPGLVLGRDRMAPLRRLGRAIAEPEWPAPRWRPWVAGLAIWLAPLPAALRRRTLERFSIRGEQATRIVRFGRDAEKMLRVLARARGRGAVDAILGEQPEEIIQALHALADLAVRRRILRWAAEDRRRRAPVTGSDLQEIGLAGPDLGRALARIRSGFLDGEIANREEALALAGELKRRAQTRAPAARAKRGARPDSRSGSRREKAARAGEGAAGKVAGDDAIADTADDRRRTTASPGSASPQADPSR